MTMRGASDIGRSIYLPWIDDNGILASAEQMSSLNNQSLMAIPALEPESSAMLLAGLELIGFAARHGKTVDCEFSGFVWIRLMFQP